jgi:hypothetical protein
MSTCETYCTLSLDGYVECKFSGILEECDYGVPHGPVFWELDPGSVELEEIELFGKYFTKEDFYDTFGEEGGQALIDLLAEYIDDDEWKGEEA